MKKFLKNFEIINEIIKKIQKIKLWKFRRKFEVILQKVGENMRNFGENLIEV